MIKLFGFTHGSGENAFQVQIAFRKKLTSAFSHTTIRLLPALFPKKQNCIGIRKMFLLLRTDQVIWNTPPRGRG